MRASTKAQYDKRHARRAARVTQRRRHAKAVIGYTVNIAKWSRKAFLEMWPVRFCGRMTNGKYIT